MRWIRLLAAGCISLASITACGSDNASRTETPASHPDVSTCLERSGAEVAIREVDSTSKMAEAHLPSGDLIFIGRLPSPNISGKTIHAVRKKRHENGLEGIMIASTVDRGSVLVLVIGHEGVEGGLPAAASEQLARVCATRTGARMGSPPGSSASNGGRLVA